MPSTLTATNHSLQFINSPLLHQHHSFTLHSSLFTLHHHHHHYHHHDHDHDPPPVHPLSRLIVFIAPLPEAGALRLGFEVVSIAPTLAVVAASQPNTQSCVTQDRTGLDQNYTGISNHSHSLTLLCCLLSFRIHTLYMAHTTRFGFRTTFTTTNAQQVSMMVCGTHSTVVIQYNYY